MNKCEQAERNAELATFAKRHLARALDEALSAAQEWRFCARSSTDRRVATDVRLALLEALGHLSD